MHFSNAFTDSLEKNQTDEAKKGETPGEKLLIDALRYYAEPRSWVSCANKVESFPVIIKNDWQDIYRGTITIIKGGKFAKETLAEFFATRGSTYKFGQISKLEYGLRLALEWYANPANWESYSHGTGKFPVIAKEDWEHGFKSSQRVSCAGRKARIALRKLGAAASLRKSLNSNT